MSLVLNHPLLPLPLPISHDFGLPFNILDAGAPPPPWASRTHRLLPLWKRGRYRERQNPTLEVPFWSNQVSLALTVTHRSGLEAALPSLLDHEL